MTLQEAIALIGHPHISEKPAACWGDLGCGTGLFTYALANLLPKESSIFAIDKTMVPLAVHPNPHDATILPYQMDFTREVLPFEYADGILMANSLHYVANQINFIDAIGTRLTTSGSFLVVEYDTNRPNKWVPYPVGRYALEKLFANAGYRAFTELGRHRSRYGNNDIYATLVQR